MFVAHTQGGEPKLSDKMLFCCCWCWILDPGPTVSSPEP